MPCTKLRMRAFPASPETHRKCQPVRAGGASSCLAESVAALRVAHQGDCTRQEFSVQSLLVGSWQANAYRTANFRAGGCARGVSSSRCRNRARRSLGYWRSAGTLVAGCTAPQQSISPVSRKAQVWNSPPLTARNLPVGASSCPTWLSPSHLTRLTHRTGVKPARVPSGTVSDVTSSAFPGGCDLPAPNSASAGAGRDTYTPDHHETLESGLGILARERARAHLRGRPRRPWLGVTGDGTRRQPHQTVGDAGAGSGDSGRSALTAGTSLSVPLIVVASAVRRHRGRRRTRPVANPPVALLRDREEPGQLWCSRRFGRTRNAQSCELASPRGAALPCRASRTLWCLHLQSQGAYPPSHLRPSPYLRPTRRQR